MFALSPLLCSYLDAGRIETVGEERARHMSESAAGGLHWPAGRRKRAATLGSEVSPRLCLLFSGDIEYVGLGIKV